MIWFIIASAVIGYTILTVKMNKAEEAKFDAWLREEYPPSRFPHLHS